jgi:hypothetical protein
MRPPADEISTMSTDGPKALVITAAGINCDLELAQSFAAAGAVPESVLLSELLRNPSRIDNYRLIGLPGGFSFGDDIAAGRIMGALMRRSLVAGTKRGFCMASERCGAIHRAIAEQHRSIPRRVDACGDSCRYALHLDARP